MRRVYLDASAGVKLLIGEEESSALRRWLDDRTTWTSSALFRVEVVRAALRQVTEGNDVVLAARDLMTAITLLDVEEVVLGAAAELRPVGIRTLDALHLATALRLGDELEAIVTYDRRMIDGARGLGLPVASPA
ncbi:MAG: type II toxin-antitoxin system VapC family toxin [Chloroflexota bacterium]